MAPRALPLTLTLPLTPNPNPNQALQQQIPLAAGSISCGETVVFGHYEQDGLLPSPDQRVLDIVQEAVSEAPGGGEDAAADKHAASALMTRFLFPRSRWYARAEKLSGGERRRLQMLQVLARQPNVLLLDEPTNDLDLQVNPNLNPKPNPNPNPDPDPNANPNPDPNPKPNQGACWMLSCSAASTLSL